MTYGRSPRKSRKPPPKDPVTGRSIRSQGEQVDEAYLTPDGRFDGSAWNAAHDERCDLFNTTSLAAVVGVSEGHLPALLNDPHFHHYEIEFGQRRPIIATMTSSAQAYRALHDAEVRASRGAVGRRQADNLIR